jgi:GT2 family glycosyltransferase
MLTSLENDPSLCIAPSHAQPAAASEPILPILVLYKTKLSDSSAYQTLDNARKAYPQSTPGIAVFDNSLIRSVAPELENELLAYRHDPANGGVAGAYNWALQIASARGYRWLLLIDQDARLPEDYIENTTKLAVSFEDQEKVVAIVPHLVNRGTIVSPQFVHLGCRSAVDTNFTGISDKEITALNSGTLLRTRFASQLGGFPMKYRLDMLDHWIFSRIYKSGHCAVISPFILEHDLSVADYRANIDIERYKSILKSEITFVREESGPLERALYPLRLLLRSVKQLAVYRRPILTAETLRGLLRLLVRS